MALSRVRDASREPRCTEQMQVVGWWVQVCMVQARVGARSGAGKLHEPVYGVNVRMRGIFSVVGMAFKSRQGAEGGYGSIQQAVTKAARDLEDASRFVSTVMGPSSTRAPDADTLQTVRERWGADVADLVNEPPADITSRRRVARYIESAVPGVGTEVDFNAIRGANTPETRRAMIEILNAVGLPLGDLQEIQETDRAVAEREARIEATRIPTSDLLSAGPAQLRAWINDREGVEVGSRMAAQVLLALAQGGSIPDLPNANLLDLERRGVIQLDPDGAVRRGDGGAPPSTAEADARPADAAEAQAEANAVDAEADSVERRTAPDVEKTLSEPVGGNGRRGLLPTLFGWIGDLLDGLAR